MKFLCDQDLYFMYAYEDFSNARTGAAVRAAQNILSNGWSRRGYPLIRLDGSIPWLFATQQERTWNFYIHCWDMLDPLLRAYSEARDTSFLLPAIAVARDWVCKHSAASADQQISPFAWYDMAVGLRAYRLAYIIDAGREADLLNKDDDDLLWQSLLAHQAYLANDANIVFHNNHGYYQVAGQLAMGRRFSEKSMEMAEAYKQGVVRLRVMINQQFSVDGVHREHSPDYHRMVYLTLSALISSGLVEDPAIIEFSASIERALSRFVLPNQRLVNFGDSDYRLVKRNAAEAGRKWSTPEMRYWVSAGQVGDNSGTGLAVYPEGGYFIYRSKSDDLLQTSYLAQTAAFHSRTHKHADDLSFFWFDRGSEILIDAGRYGYLGKTEWGSKLWQDGHWYSDPYRVYCESTRAHNCLEFDGKNYPRKAVKPYGSAVGRSIVTQNGLVVLETECRHFRGNRHARVLVLMPGKWLIVYDWHHDNLYRKHDVRQWFHLGQEWQLQPRAAGFQARHPETQGLLQIASFFSDARVSRPYRGETEPAYQGWWSPKEREIQANYAFCYEQEQQAGGTLATIFCFSDVLRIEPGTSIVNKSGRNARLSWQDDAGLHTLKIQRPQEGDLEVDYTV